MKAQKISFTVGKFVFTFGVGDENHNGDVDVSLAIALFGIPLPAIIVDLNAATAARAKDGFEDLFGALAKPKPRA